MPESQDLDLYDDIEEKKNWCSRRLQKYMIEANNARLKKFHLIVSLSLYVDFFLTSFVMGNYKFIVGDYNSEFMYHETIFQIIIFL